MEGKKVCYFHKFNFCKKGGGCKYFHHSEICEEKCNIKLCLKRHPQTSLCMFYIMFGMCKNDNSCKFIHQTPEPSQDANNEEIQSLKSKVQELEEDIRNIKFKHKQINDVLKERIINLEASVKMLLQNDMIRQQDEENETANESLTIQNGIDISDKKQDESSVMENEPSYNIYADLEYKDILKNELRIAQNMKYNIKDVIENLKARKIDETINKLLILNFNVQNEGILDKNFKRHSENKHLSENFYEMIAKFVKIGEILKSTAKNKFKKVAENELNNLCEEICKVEIDKLAKLQGLFGES